MPMKFSSIADLYDRRRSFFRNLFRMVRYILSQKHTPEEVAAGVALGLFLAFAAPPGMQMLPAAALASVMGWNVLAAVSAVFVSNPFTMPLIYPVAAYIGSRVTGISVTGAIPLTDERFWVYATDPWLHGRIIVLLIVGCVLLGSAFSMAGYFVTRWLVVVGRQLLERRQHIRLYLRNGADESEDDFDEP